MSRHLPRKASLEYLRKQAKQLLREGAAGKLAGAQRKVAEEYGFPNWAALKTHVESLRVTPAQALQSAVCDGDTKKVRALLSSYPELRASINEPLPTYGFGQQALFAAVQRSDRDMIEVLLEGGADIRKRTEWWAGGFGVLDECDPSLLPFLEGRGAVLDVHAAARLGLLAELKSLVLADPQLVHAKGGDGQTPLHFASTVEVAEFLLKNGADVDARDIDHESTPAQYMLRVNQKRHYANHRQDVARYLVSRGCTTDLLMAAALGEKELVKKHLDTDPGCIRMTVSEEWFPKRNPRAGGTIYIWTLGMHRTAHAVARDFGHEDVFELLLERTPHEMKLALACELGDEDVFKEFFRQTPDKMSRHSEAERVKLPNAAQNNNGQAVRLMLQAGWPVDTPGEMGATALHWAGFHGNAEMARTILRFKPPLDLKSREYPGTALSWAVYGSGNSWHRDTGDYVGTIEALVQAGSVWPENAEQLEPSDAVLEMMP